MSPRLARQFQEAVPIIVFFIIVALTWDNVRWHLAPEVGPREPLTVTFIGVLLALPVILFESSAVAKPFRRLPFWAAVLSKSATYFTVLAGAHGRRHIARNCRAHRARRSCVRTSRIPSPLGGSDCTCYTFGGKCKSPTHSSHSLTP